MNDKYRALYKYITDGKKRQNAHTDFDMRVDMRATSHNNHIKKRKKKYHFLPAGFLFPFRFLLLVSCRMAFMPSVSL